MDREICKEKDMGTHGYICIYVYLDPGVRGSLNVPLKPLAEVLEHGRAARKDNVLVQAPAITQRDRERERQEDRKRERERWR